jgi:dephospho-CoA kinase
VTVRLGLTGGLASGKSTVAELLAARGCEVVDADRLVADLYRPGEPGAEVVRELLGDDHLTADGSVDRPRVAAAVFADADLRRRLERAVWPLVRRRFGERAAAAPADAVVVLEATLLVEAGFAPSFDLVVTVEAPRETRLARAVARGLSEDEARSRLEAQGDGEARRAAAHRRLDNDGTLEQLEARVDALLADVRGGRLPDFVFVTGNRHKAAEAERILGRAVECADLELPEIQSLDLVEVLRAKADAAWRRLGRPLVVEESGLDLAALNGFPGPLVKWMLSAAGAAGLARTGLALGEPRVTSRCALLYKHGSGADDATPAAAAVDGELVLPPRGDGGFGWDPVVVPAGEDRTLAELGDADKDAFSPRGRAWRELRRRLAGWV